ncbi:MAG: 30S ribosomal protein S18 [Planctomycetota bacterium]
MERRPMERRERGPRGARTGDGERTKCRFCRAGVVVVDYKDISSLQKMVSMQGKFNSRRRSGNCAGHQRSSKIALKRARFLSLMPYVGG